MAPVRLAIVGAGNRGTSYAEYALEHPELATVVAVADPRSFYRKRMAQAHNIEDDLVFEGWPEMAAKFSSQGDNKCADAVLVCTPDQLHKEPAVAFANLGYHLLVEKPMAVTESDCREIADAVVKNNVILAVCHVLRYTKYFRKMKEIVQSGVLGEIVNMQHTEPVGYWHFAHSYVRGNWRNEEQSTFSLLAKSCHDIDMVRYIMDRPCVQVHSFGGLHHFKKENQPQGATDRCTTCPVEADCAFSAKKVYLDKVKSGHTGWPVGVIAEEPTVESVMAAIEDGPYGRCVYSCDNDVCDNQVVNMQFEGGATASFTMIAFSEKICVRSTKIYGTKAELTGDGDKIEVFDFNTNERTTFEPKVESNTKMQKHGGGDYETIKAFVQAVGANDKTLILSGPDETLQSHLITFAAERSRREGVVVTDGLSMDSTK